MVSELLGPFFIRYFPCTFICAFTQFIHPWRCSTDVRITISVAHTDQNRPHLIVKSSTTVQKRGPEGFPQECEAFWECISSLSLYFDLGLWITSSFFALVTVWSRLHLLTFAFCIHGTQSTMQENVCEKAILSVMNLD